MKATGTKRSGEAGNKEAKRCGTNTKDFKQEKIEVKRVRSMCARESNLMQWLEHKPVAALRQ